MTLTEVSYFSRKLAPFGVLLFVIMLILFYSFKLIFLFGELNTAKVSTLNPIFKELKPIEFMEASSSAGYSYIMDTVEGEPVTATDAAKVFLIPEKKFRFGYKEKISLIAKNFGFEGSSLEYVLSPKKTEGIFQDGKKKLEIDITNFNFKYEQDITRSPELFETNGIPDKESAQNKAVDFLKSFDRYPDDLALGRMNVIFMQYDKESSKTAILEDNKGANMVEVDFYRADIDQYPIVSPKYYNSQNYVTMVHKGDKGYEVVRAQIRFFEKSDAQVGIYPIMDGKSAFEMLATGSGHIVSGKPSQSEGQIAIKRMFMGYYDPDIYQQYLQPVYVFLGDNNFVAYVSAVTDEYLIDHSRLK